MYNACFSHKIQLVYSSAKKIPKLLIFYENINEVAKYFASSSKRTTLLQFKMTIYNETRWSSKLITVKQLYKNYDAILRCLQHFAENEDDEIAEKMLQYFNNFQTVILTVFSFKILTYQNSCSKFFQNVRLTKDDIKKRIQMDVSILKELSTNDIIKEAKSYV